MEIMSYTETGMVFWVVMREEPNARLGQRTFCLQQDGKWRQAGREDRVGEMGSPMWFPTRQAAEQAGKRAQEEMMASDQRYTIESGQDGYYVVDNRPDYRMDEESKMYCGADRIWGSHPPTSGLFRELPEAWKFIDELNSRGKEERPG